MGKVDEALDQAKAKFAGKAPDTDYAGRRVDVVREALRAFGEGDLDGFTERFNDEVEWVAPEGNNFPGGAELSGKQDVKEVFAEDVKRTYGSFGFDPHYFLEADPKPWVVVLGRFVGEGAKRGYLDVPGAQVWEFDENDDDVRRVVIYADSAAFLDIITEQDERREQEEAEEDEDSSEEGSNEESSSEDEGSDEQEDSGESKDEDSGEGKDESSGEGKDESSGEGDEESSGSSEESSGSDEKDDDDNG